MPLESLQPGARPDVKRLATENHEEEEPNFYNPENDFNSFGININEELEKFEANRQQVEYLELAAEIKKIFPERNFDFSEEIFESILDEANSELSKRNYVNYFEYFAKLRIAYPDKEKMARPDPAAYEQIARHGLSGKHQHDLEVLIDIKTLFPDEDVVSLLSEEIWNEIIEKLLSEKNLSIFVSTAYKIKLINPEKYTELKTTHAMWTEIYIYLKSPWKLSQDDSVIFRLTDLLELKILADYDVEVGKRGFKYRKPISEKGDQTAIPKIREF